MTKTSEWFLDMDPIDTATDIRIKHGWNGKETIPNQLVAQMCGKRDSQRDQLARFIVKSLNSHIELLSACKAAFELVEGLPARHCIDRKEVLTVLSSAIQKAEADL